ncbi:hypothetical protein OS493_033126, partial [Desmophyllum pertusum]
VVIEIQCSFRGGVTSSFFEQLSVELLTSAPSEGGVTSSSLTAFTGLRSSAPSEGDVTSSSLTAFSGLWLQCSFRRWCDVKFFDSFHLDSAPVFLQKVV